MSLYEEDLQTPTAHFSASTGATLESQPLRTIRPLGEQIIIRVFPPSSVGSIIIPDSAKGSTHQGEKGDLVHFVEAEVVAVGPGKRGRNRHLLPDMILALKDAAQLIDSHEPIEIHGQNNDFVERLYDLAREAGKQDTLIPLQVKPGDRILYHPSVQSFDRRIPAELLGLPATEECYICNEMTSVLAVLDRK
jgi:co-chaperonin GroES (HSP10)